MKKIFGFLVLISMAVIPSFAYMGSSFDEPINVCASHILVKDKLQADKLKLEIKNFEDFQQLAAIYSECPSGRKGGYLGCFGRGQMVKEFEKAAFNANTGEVVGPVKTQFGYHVVLLIDERDSTPLPLKELEPQIKNILDQQAVAEIFDKLYNSS